MTTFKVSFGFANLSDADLITFVQAVIVAITGNANFATPSPTLISITAALNAFIAAVSAAADGGKTLTALKNQARNALIAIMRLLGSYVEDTAGNDQPILLSSGFQIFSLPHADRPVPDAPQNLRLSDGQASGTVAAQVAVVPGAVVYELRYSTDVFGPDMRWIHLPVSTSSKMLIPGIAPGSTLWAQARAINSQGVSNWSDPAMLAFTR